MKKDKKVGNKMKKTVGFSPKIECAKICFAEVSKCAKRIEKAMAKCGVRLSGDYDDPAGVIIFNMFSFAFEDIKASTYKPTNSDIKNLASDFDKIYTRKKKSFSCVGN